MLRRVLARRNMHNTERNLRGARAIRPKHKPARSRVNLRMRSIERQLVVDGFVGIRKAADAASFGLLVGRTVSGHSDIALQTKALRPVPSPGR
jgi:hypothetical protein